MRSNNNLRVDTLCLIPYCAPRCFLFFVSGSTKIFADRYTLVTEWKDVSGLKEGAIVRLSGWDVGEVLSIQFAKENKRKLIVHLSIENKYKNLIRQCTKEQESPTDIQVLPKVSSRARIDTVGILGDKLVTINMGDSDCTIIEDGEFIFAEEAIDIIEYAKKVTSIVNRLDSIGRKVDIMLGTEKDARKTSKSIAHSVQEMEGMLTEVKEEMVLFMHSCMIRNSPRTSRRVSIISTVRQLPSTLPWKHLEKGLVLHTNFCMEPMGVQPSRKSEPQQQHCLDSLEIFEQSDSLAYAILFDPKQKEILSKSHAVCGRTTKSQ